MKNSKQARRQAKLLLQACRTDGVLNEDLVRQTVSVLLAKKPRGYMDILKQFLRLLKLDRQARTALVESAVELTPDQVQEVTGNLQKQHGAGLHISFQTNPALLGGLRIRVGSDIYDGSVAGRLEAIGSSF